MKKILIADDSLFMRMTLKDNLPEGYEVVEADSGAKTLEQFKKDYTGPEYAVGGSEARQWADTANYPWIANTVAALNADPTVDTDTEIDWAVTTPAAPRGGTPATSACGNGTCDADEDCTSCPDDCPGRTGGKPSLRFCCGNGSCEPVGEDANICPIDCF